MPSIHALKDLLTEGYETGDAEYSRDFVAKMSRTVYLMVRTLAEKQRLNRKVYLSSTDLQGHIDHQLKKSGVKPHQEVFNPVDHFSKNWTQSLIGQATRHFKPEYPKLFERDDRRHPKDKRHYRIRPRLFSDVTGVLSELARRTDVRKRRRKRPQSAMSLRELTDPAAVRRAALEFDQIGREQFLTKYGFGPARNYFLFVNGQSYDSKAIVGAAYGYQHPGKGALRASDFSGGNATVVRKLEALGFSTTKGSATFDLALQPLVLVENERTAGGRHERMSPASDTTFRISIEGRSGPAVPSCTTEA